ncbi:MAG: hut operon positive regulator HutP [Clostridiales bacterium]|nr:MAG: hut operon positive regulator HutP [Clostridiales bacterium]
MNDHDTNAGSRDVAAAALRVALSAGVEDEQRVRAEIHARGMKTAAANFGGEFIPSINKIIERAIVAARREGVIGTTHLEEGAVAGAAREALSQIMNKAIGLNIGGKIAVARHEEHVSVAMFFGIGLLHLNEVAVGLGHRAI